MIVAWDVKFLSGESNRTLLVMKQTTNKKSMSVWVMACCLRAPMSQCWSKSMLHYDIPPVLKKSGQFAMPETCENWLCLVNSHIYCVCQTYEIYQILPYSIHRVRQHSKSSFIWNNDLQTSEITTKLKSSLCVRPVNILIFLHCTTMR